MIDFQPTTILGCRSKGGKPYRALQTIPEIEETGIPGGWGH